MKITIEQVQKKKPEIAVERGQIYKKEGIYYLVTKAVDDREIKYNLTNLATGNRWTEELGIKELKAEIERQGFELVSVKEFIIREEV